MKKQEMQRLINVENKIYKIAQDFGLEFCPIEFDVIPEYKMLEIMAYHIPGNISNWKYGRDFERIRTIHEKIHDGLPYEVVINSSPARAYLMKSNTFAVQCLVMAHVVAHVAFFTMNKHFQRTKRDMIPFLSEASKRFNKYEELYGIDVVEKIVDAAHSIQMHSNPFDTETESEKRERIYEQEKRTIENKPTSEFADLHNFNDNKIDKETIKLHNRKLWMALKNKKPVEPTEDLLRFIIDNSNNLDDWEKDICEVLRQEGEYFWPQIRTKYCNEGFATYWHEKIMDILFKEEVLSTSDHAQYNYSNSLVKMRNPYQMNPYLIGSEMWKDIVERWDKGKHGLEYDNCNNLKEKEKWDTKEMKGHEKMFEVVRTHTDWFFMQNFLTADMVRKLDLYIYVKKETPYEETYVITKQDAEDIAKMIIASFGNHSIPKIEITDGNYEEKGELYLIHRWNKLNLKKEYCKKTMVHIYDLWGKPIHLKTKINNEKEITITYTGEKDKFYIGMSED